METCNHVITTLHEDEGDVEGYAEWLEDKAKEYRAGSARDHFDPTALNNYCYKCGARIEPDEVKEAISAKDYTLREGLVGWRIKDSKGYAYHINTNEDRDIIRRALAGVDNGLPLKGSDGRIMEPLYVFGEKCTPPDDGYTFAAFRTTLSPRTHSIVAVTKGRHSGADARCTSIAMFIKEK